ncbi:MAG: putative cytosol aminopeptidase [Candidatus Adlerbacteria bacterium]|nr:putative cytosol aminopeptidase [Candidatus Adlerbacteria bacterium]
MIKITLNNKAADQIAGYTPIRLTEKKLDRVVIDGGKETLEIGIGPRNKVTAKSLPLLVRQIITSAKKHSFKKIAIDAEGLTFANIEGVDAARITATNLELANYDYTTQKTKPEEGWTEVTDIVLCGAVSPEGRVAISRGQIIGQQINQARDWCNTPGGDMTPKYLANATKAAAKGSKATVKVLGRAEMQKLGMGAVLAIAKGSAEEPQFIVVEYWGAAKTKKPLVLVGKGVTFDTGGLNIKTGDHMYEMHMDMTGGATVINTVLLAAKLGIKTNLVALVPAVENAPGTNAVRPGDIVKSLSGKTIEILNTDAEGRVILADGITYAKRYNPEAVVDVATLTGAALIALGTVASAFMTNEKSMSIMDIMNLSAKSGDPMWPFPCWAEYEPMTKGTFGDVPNLSTMGNSRYGGVIAGGMFLKRFADDLNCQWLHLDIAPRMTSNPGDQLAKGATGEPIQFLLALAEQSAENNTR